MPRPDMASPTHDTAAPIGLRRDAVGWVGAVVMSAAIMGRHVALPLVGAGLMVVLLVEQIVQQTDAPYTWFPWLIVGWVALVAAVALWLGARRPDALRRAGAVLATGDVASAVAGAASERPVTAP